MKLLLDTHVWLRWLADPEELSEGSRAAIAAFSNLVAISAASVWEVEIKRSRGGLHFDGDPAATAVEGGFEPLPISLVHAGAAGELPLHHRDPFDRILVAQARLEEYTLVTRDRVFQAYDVPLLNA